MIIFIICRMALTLNFSDLKFEEPIHHELPLVGRHYYTQALKYKGSDLLATSDWFRSDGFKYSIDKKPELLVKLFPNTNLMLKGIEDVAIETVKLPAEYQHSGPIEPVFKRMPDITNRYVKINYDAAIFNKVRLPIKKEELSYGDYRVMLHVKGIYIGAHGYGGKLASLQVRICQIQFIPIAIQCLFPNIAQQAAVQKPSNNAPETPQPDVTANLTTKKTRRPKLQRQNAMIENRQQQKQENLQSLPSEFFADLDEDTNMS